MCKFPMLYFSILNNYKSIIGILIWFFHYNFFQSLLFACVFYKEKFSRIKNVDVPRWQPYIFLRFLLLNKPTRSVVQKNDFLRYICSILWQNYGKVSSKNDVFSFFNFFMAIPNENNNNYYLCYISR